MRKGFPYRFFALAFAWSWLLWLAPVLSPNPDANLQIGFTMLALFGPSLAGLVCLWTLEGRPAAFGALKSLLDWKLGWGVWLGAPAILAGVAAAAWFLPELWGEPRLTLPPVTVWSLASSFVVMVLLGGGQEELGWRGYVLDKLEARLGSWWGNVALGLVWGLWHLPLFFLPALSYHYSPVWLFPLTTIGYSWLFAWARERSGKRPFSGVLLHGTANAVLAALPTVVMTQGSPQPRYWVWAVLIFAAGFAVQLTRKTSSR